MRCKGYYYKIALGTRMYIYSLHILGRQKKAVLFANFGNYSKGIFGNHLTANGCQNPKFCDIVEIRKKLKISSFFQIILVKSHFKIGSIKIPKMTR